MWCRLNFHVKVEEGDEMIFDEAEEIKQSDLIHNKNMIEEEEELLEDVLEEDEMDE